MKKLSLPFVLCLVTWAFFACQKDAPLPTDTQNSLDGVANDRSSVVIPAGSHNALAAALQTANTVILAAGIHTEDNFVVVTGNKNILGQEGAILRLKTNPWFDASLPMEVGLHLINASNALISHIEFQSSTPIGCVAILLQNSEKVTVQNCKITGFQYGVLVEKSPRVFLKSNVVQCPTDWQTGAIPEALGMVVINGEGAKAEDNEISGGVFGFWGCDKNGIYRRNYTHDNFIGMISCKVPFGGFRLPDGTAVGAQFSCTNWKLSNNVSKNNSNAGYLVIDGSNHNVLTNNDASNNGSYDYETVGDSFRFGFLTPFTFDNTIQAKAGQTVKLCGVNNTATGGILINTNLDPCN